MVDFTAFDLSSTPPCLRLPRNNSKDQLPGEELTLRSCCAQENWPVLWLQGDSRTAATRIEDLNLNGLGASERRGAGRGPGSHAHLVERRKLGANILQEILQRIHGLAQWGIWGLG